MYKVINNYPFSKIGKEKIGEGEEKVILHFDVPAGCVAFLYKIGVDLNVEWEWIIDDERVKDELGSINTPAFYNPPYLIRKYIELKAKNSGEEKIVNAFCEGLVYEELFLREKEEEKEEPKLIELVEEIKEKLDEERTVGKVFDKKVEVTDKIYMLYEKGGLNWTACDITNVGDNDVYFCVNEWKRPEAPLEPNLTANIDLGKKGAIKKIYFLCDSGKSTTVYIRVLK